MPPPSSLLFAVPSRDALNGIFEAVPVAILVSDRQGNICLTNAKARMMLGYSEAELRGIAVEALLPEIYHEPLRAFLTRFWQVPESTPTSIGPEFRMRRKDGSDAWVQMGFNPVLIDGVDYAVGAMVGVDERRRTELALRESEEKFEKIFYASPDAISVHELESGRYVDVNPGFLHLFGYGRDDVIGRTPLELGIWMDLGEREKFLTQLQRDGLVRNSQLRFLTRTGDVRICELSSEAVEIGGRAHNVTVLRDMTARLQAEHALRESEEKFATAFRVSPDIMSISEFSTGRYLEVNEAHEKIFGFTRAESIGKSPLELGILSEAHVRDEMLRQMMQQNGRIRDFKVKAHNRQGDALTVQLSAELIQFGGRQCVLRNSQDITAAVKAEQALRESEEKFAKAFQASPDAISITDLETGRYIEANSGHERIYGFTREEVIGRTVLELGCYQDPEDRERVVAAIRSSGSVRNLELNCCNKRRERITVLYSGEAIEMNGRKCIVSVIHDITGRKLAEAVLRESEARFRSYFESPFIGMAITSGDRRWLEVNDHLCRMLGYTREELLALRWNEITVPEDVTTNEALLGRVIAGEIDGCTFEKRYRRKDGSILYANLSTRSFRGRDGVLDYFLTVIQDISEKHEAEQAQVRLEHQLRQAQKLEALGTLAGGIAHDFNNILSAMIVYRELAVMDIDRPDDLRQHLAEIGLASNRAKDLVRQILTFSRQQQQERQAVQLHPVVLEALQLLRASLPATIEILPMIDDQAPQVLADSSQVHQIIMNLCTNAAHAMRDQPGRLKVTLGRRLVDEVKARLHAGLQPGAYVCLSVADTGHGMDSTTVARIFEPFFTTKGPSEGTGLGLSVVHGIMEDHDGVITVDSRLGEGTLFELYFPNYAGTMSAAQEPDESTPRGSGEAVLLIDDERPICDAMRNTLHRLGYRVTAFTNPVDALVCFRATPQAFDLLVTDHTMPRMTGLDIIQEVHRVRPELSAVMVSGLSGAWTPEKLRGFNICEVVAKPLNFAGLAQAVHRAIDRRRRPSQ